MPTSTQSPTPARPPDAGGAVGQCGDGASAARQKESIGIDCFAETIRHELHHKRERHDWWGTTNPKALMKKGLEHLIAVDKDTDLVPNKVEKSLQRRGFGCDYDSRYSCTRRPYPNVIDVEMNAYWVGWEWVVGSADDEDWSVDGRLGSKPHKCGQKKWRQPKCPSLDVFGQ